MELEELDDQRESLNVLYYGDPGTGKTSHALAMAKLGPVILINAEGGAKKRALARLGIPVENIRVHSDISYGALEELYWELKAELDDDPEAYAGVVWDSATDMQKELMEIIVVKAAKKAENRGMERDDTESYQEDWGKMTEQMRRLTRKFRDLPVHFAVTALERKDENDEGKLVVGPAVTPAYQNDLSGYVDIMIRTDTAEVAGTLEFQGYAVKKGKYQAKDRFSVLPPIMMEPTFDRVYDYVTEELERESDPLQVAAKERRKKDEDAEEEKPKAKKTKK